jgi:pimeloyl-ACP methyl ester carboxylesterase
VLREHREEARLSRRGEHGVVTNAGHWIQLDDPQAVADAIERVVGIVRSLTVASR